MPPSPKPDGQRRRRNLGAHEWRYLPDGPSGIDPPPMPTKRGNWSNEAKRAWLVWWASPMARVWTEADTVALRRALRLVDDITGGRNSDHAALTALEDRLGLSPKSRRLLQWEIDRATNAQTVTPPPPRPPGSDPRLRAVS